MEAKDTVMSEKELQALLVLDNYNRERPTHIMGITAKAQAEISYKAGYKKASDESNAISHLDCYEDGKKAGMKEVVEWINTHWWDRANYPEWQAFLKEDRDMIREQMADLQLKLDVGWVANCPVKIKQQGEKAIAEWKTDQLIIVLCAEIEKMGLSEEEIRQATRITQTAIATPGGYSLSAQAQLQKILNKLKEEK